MKEIIIDIDINKRIDVYLAEKLDISRVAVQRMLENEMITVN